MRLRSLDVFRGLTMAGMVIVNNPGDWGTVYAPLLHAEWHGWTPTDLIFPAFLFIVGVAIAQVRAERHTGLTVVRRALVLIALGLFLSGFPFFNLERWRFPGVLQRIGVCYLAAAIVFRTVSVPGDVTSTTRRLLVAVVACLGGYWALLALVPPPGGSAGDLTAEGSLGAWLDRAVFGTHLWKARWDPEGLLSSLPAVGTTLLGVVSGLRIAHARPRSVAPLLLGAGVVATLLGLAWDLVFPINKALWTSSYALFTAGLGMIVLGLLHQWLDDGRSTPLRTRLSEPMVALGRNALLLFVLSGLVARMLTLLKLTAADGAVLSLQQVVYHSLFPSNAAPRLASLLYALMTLAALYALLAWLHRRRWYWSV